MFSLRDSSIASSSGTDEDSFGWWIGVESHSSETKEQAASDSSESPASRDGSDDVLCSGNYKNLSRDLAGRRSQQLRLRSQEPELIELCSFEGDEEEEAELEDDNDRPLCYTPERLIKTDDYRILPPSPRSYPTLGELSRSARRSSRSAAAAAARRQPKTIDERKIGAAHLAALLHSQQRSASSSPRSNSERCCCIRYGDGEVFLHTDSCVRYSDKVAPSSEFGARRLYSEYGSGCDEISRLEDPNDAEDDFRDDTSGVSSVDAVSGTQVDDWSCSIDEEENVDDGSPTRLQSRLFDELACVSFECTLAVSEKQSRRPHSSSCFRRRESQASEVNEVVSILADLENDPKRAEALLQGDDRFRSAKQSNHDSLARLALAIEPDGKLVPTQCGRTETELEHLRDKVERLQDSNRNLYEEISTLRRDFTKDEWKVSHLSEDVNKLRNEVYEMRYLDDLLKLLNGELERISNRNWPFTIGHTKRGTEEINLVV